MLLFSKFKSNESNGAVSIRELFEGKEDASASQPSITYKTLNSYLNALQKLFIVEDVKAWQPSLRSKTAIRTASKRQFVDPSITTAVVGQQLKSN